jgi:hypothetical protein
MQEILRDGKSLRNSRALPEPRMSGMSAPGRPLSTPARPPAHWRTVLGVSLRAAQMVPVPQNSAEREKLETRVKVAPESPYISGLEIGFGLARPCRHQHGQRVAMLVRSMHNAPQLRHSSSPTGLRAAIAALLTATGEDRQRHQGSGCVGSLGVRHGRRTTLVCLVGRKPRPLCKIGIGRPLPVRAIPLPFVPRNRGGGREPARGRIDNGRWQLPLPPYGAIVVCCPRLRVLIKRLGHINRGTGIDRQPRGCGTERGERLRLSFSGSQSPRQHAAAAFAPEPCGYAHIALQTLI